MSKAPSPLGLVISEEMKAKFDALPIPRSSAIKQAIINAADDPQLLVRAFEHRMKNPSGQTPLFTTSFWAGAQIDRYCDMLSEMTELPKRQVVKLAMEAYINKL